MSLRGVGGDVPLLDNARRARLVRWITLGSAALCAGFLYWAADIYHGYGLSPGDGGLLRPHGERLALATLLATLGVLPFVGMMFYTRLYLARIELHGSRLVLQSASLFGARIQEIDATRIRSIRFHDWALEPGSSVSTPWLALRVEGRRWPFLIDLAADYVDQSAIAALEPA